MKATLVLAFCLLLAACSTAPQASMDQKLVEKERLFPRLPAAQILPSKAVLPNPSNPWRPPSKQKTQKIEALLKN